MNGDSHFQSRSQAFLADTARWMTIVAVCLAPWLFGAAEAWSYMFIVLILFVALGLWILSMILGDFSASVRPVLLGPILLLGGFIGLQSLPLGPDTTRVLNPRTAAIVATANETLDAIPNETLQADIPATLSVSPSATRRSLWLYISYIAVYLIFSGSITHWHQVRHVSSVILVCGFALAMVSILGAFSDSKVMMGFYTPRHGGTHFGTFTNRNHAGALFNMLFGLASGMLISATAMHGAETLSLRERLLAFSTRQTSRIILMVFTTLLMAAAVVMSLSRGACIAILLGLGVHTLLTFFKKNPGGRTIPAAALVLILAAATLWIGWAPLLARLHKLSYIFVSDTPDSRIVATGATLLLYGTFPLVGSGFGTFKHVFPMFQPNSIDFGRWNHAHNDWAQLLAEGGIIGGTLLLVICCLWVRWLWVRWDGMIHRAQSYILGLSIGIISIAVHSFLDYSLHKAANAWMLAALCGLVTAAANLTSSRINNSSASPPPKAVQQRSNWWGHLRSPSLTTALLALALLTSSALQDFQGELEFARFLYLARSSNEAASPTPREETLVTEALSSANVIERLDMDDPDAYRDISTILFSWAIDRSVTRVTRLSLAETAAISARTSVQKAPSDYLAWIWFARTQALAGKWDSAELCLEQARYLRPHQSHVTMFGTNPQR